MAYTIAFFGTKPYDEASFNEKNKEFGFELRFFKGHLNRHNVLLTQGVDAVCIFVNDTADAEVIRTMAANGVKLLALRCAGYNNVDLKAAADNGDALAQPENSTGIMAHPGWKLFTARTVRLRYAWKDSRYHRYGKDSQNTDTYIKRVRHEHTGV